MLFVMLITHFILMHFMGGERRLYADILQRLSNPLWKTFDLVFLSLALYHGWYGIWGIVEDYVDRGSARIACLVLIATAALVLFSLGFVTIVTFSVH